MYKHEQQLQTSIATAAGLSFLGWLGAQATGPTVLPPAATAMAKGKRLKGKGGGVSGGAGGSAPVAKADLRVRPPSTLNVPKSVPRNIPSQVVWDTVKIDGTITSLTSGPAEMNFSFSLSNHPQSSSWAALFDQWTIPQVSVSYQSLLPPGSTLVPLKLYTALDFDNANAITTVTAIEDYSTCSCNVMEPQTRFVRSIRPCTKPTTSSSGSAVQRMWIDSGTPGNLFYGLRSMVSQSATAAQTISTTLTIWYAFRNQI